MEEDVKTLSDYVSIAWRRKFYILVPFVLVSFIAFPTVMMLPPVYQSTGTIAIESQQIPSELVQSTVTSFAATAGCRLTSASVASDERFLAVISK